MNYHQLHWLVPVYSILFLSVLIYSGLDVDLRPWSVGIVRVLGYPGTMLQNFLFGNR